jgi:ATP-dependent DNA ligase
MQKILEKRRKRLENEFAALPETVQLSPILTGEAHDVLVHVKEFEFEGVIAKRLDSFYIPGKTSDNWQKQKTQRSDDFLVGGYVAGRYGVEELVVGEERSKSKQDACRNRLCSRRAENRSDSHPPSDSAAG